MTEHHPGCTCPACGVVMPIVPPVQLRAGESVTIRVSHIVRPGGTRTPVALVDESEIIETTAEAIE